MCAKTNRILAFIAGLLFSSAVVAAVEPKNTVLFFLPIQDRAKITSLQEAVPTEIPYGISKKVRSNPETEKNPDYVKHGIPTSAGVSLYDKGNVPLEQATENIVQPARVLILPAESSKKAKNKGVAGTPETVTPDRIRIFPLTKPVKEIKQAARERPVISNMPVVPTPKAYFAQRPLKQSEWTKWGFEQLKNCDMDASTVLPTLYWLAVNDKLDEGKNACDLKADVAAYLRQCHPWPTVYYTPVNNAVPVRPAVQMAAELLEHQFGDTSCPALNLSGVNFAKTEFLQGALKNADFSKSYLDSAIFYNIDLSEAVFNKAVMGNVLFQDVDLTAADFRKAHVKYADFNRVKAPTTKFNAADLQNAQFRDVDFSLAYFTEADLQNTAWEDVRAENMVAARANFTKAGFDNILFKGVRAAKADFGQIVCKNCFFAHTDFSNAYFYKAVFDTASFRLSNLTQTRFDSSEFRGNVVWSGNTWDKTDFSGVNMSELNGFTNFVLSHLKVDRKTVLPNNLSDFDTVIYDGELETAATEPEKEINRYACTQRTCEERLLGRAHNQNLAVRAMTILSVPDEHINAQVWALCTMACIAKQDKKLENSQRDLLAAYVRQKRPWSSEKDLFKPYTPIEPEVQMALFLLTDKTFHRDLAHDVDLTGTDLRTADLTNSDLRLVNLAGSHLGGADLRGSKTDKAYDRFDQVVIDEFTHLPKGMEKFKPFKLPDSIVPPWWKPKTIRVFRDGTHPWTVTTEVIPFSDKYVVWSDVIPENLRD